mgnify:CR=1 FL=1
MIIGAGGVGGVVAHKCAQVPEVFSEIVLASRTLSKCEGIAAGIDRPIETAQVDALLADWESVEAELADRLDLGGAGRLDIGAIGQAPVEAALLAGVAGGTGRLDAHQEGVGYFQQTAHKGFRWSTAKGFLRPAKKRANLTVRIKAHTTRIMFEGNTAVGVEYLKGGGMHQVRARREVILSAGAIGSPQILQLSGIGAKTLLDKVGIPLIIDLPGVGQNLQDHLQVRLVYKTSQRTLNDEVNNIFKRGWVGLQYLVSRTGPLTLAASQVAIFTKSQPHAERPDIQFHMQPLSADKPGDGAHKFSAFTSSVCQLRPYSRGYLEIRSKDPLEHPAIYPNYLSDERDHQVAIDGIKVARRIAAAPALAQHIIDEHAPGNQYQSDAELLDAARRYSQTIYHPTSTCKMGRDDMAVVDERLRVHGLRGLRVVDASIMPEIVSGNTNAPTIMIAEKASDMILEDAGSIDP